MKIKLVCELTGLTDRAIRYYIEEGLISPDYTENYLGRKSFDFSKSDVDLLKSIAILRMFGFSIAHIKLIKETPAVIHDIIEEIYNKKRKMINEEQKQLFALERLDNTRLYPICELADTLAIPVEEISIPVEDTKLNLKRFVYSSIKTAFVWILGLMPVVILLTVIFTDLKTYSYPTVSFRSFVTIYLALLPTICILIMSKIKKQGSTKSIKTYVFFIICVLYLPLSFLFSLFILGSSETTDIRNYRDVDADCFANRDLLYQELFPIWPQYFKHEKQPDGSMKEVYLDARYYYRFILGFDYSYDIYAEWPLDIDNDKFLGEVSRVKGLFENYNINKHDYLYNTIEKGSYTCLIIHSKYSFKPFEKVTNNYTYYIFAYDEEDMVVRYIHGSSLENGADQPYYLELDWD